jgi:hypothetical protein
MLAFTGLRELLIDTEDIYRGITMTEPKLSALSFTGSLAFSYQFNKDDVERMGVVRPNQRLAVDPFLELKKSKLSFRTRVALYFQ